MATFRFSLGAFREQVLNAPWMVAEMRARAEKGMAFAQSISPYRASDRDVHYRDSFGVDAHPGGGVKGDRAVGIVYNTSEHARFVEYGTERMDPHYVLHRTLGSMG